MPNRDGSPTRAERASARRQTHHQSRVDDAADPVAAAGAAWSYFAAVVRRVELASPRKAEQIARDTAEYLLRQANAHDMSTTGGKR